MLFSLETSMIFYATYIICIIWWIIHCNDASEKITTNLLFFLLVSPSPTYSRHPSGKKSHNRFSSVKRGRWRMREENLRIWNAMKNCELINFNSHIRSFTGTEKLHNVRKEDQQRRSVIWNWLNNQSMLNLIGEHARGCSVCGCDKF